MCLFSGTSRTSAAVCVAFRIIGQAVVDDVGEVVDVQTACGNVGSHQQLQVAYAEFLHDGIALRLAQFTVQRVGIVTFLHQFVGNFLSFLAGTAEDDAVYLRIVIYDAFQGGVLIFGMNGEHHVFHVAGSFISASDGDFLCIVQVFLEIRAISGLMVAENSSVLRSWGTSARMALMLSVNPCSAFRPPRP